MQCGMEYLPGGMSAGTQQREMASLVVWRTDGGAQWCKLLTMADVTSAVQLAQMTAPMMHRLIISTWLPVSTIHHTVDVTFSN